MAQKSRFLQAGRSLGARALRQERLKGTDKRAAYARHLYNIQAAREVILGAETHLSFEFSLCLSRACLGKMFTFILKMAQKARFLTARLSC
jgi:hypothetical protein